MSVSNNAPLANSLVAEYKSAWAQFLARTWNGSIIRLLLIGASFVLYWFLIVLLTDFPGELPVEWETSLGPVLYLFLNLLIPFFQPEVLVYLIPVITALLAGIFVASLYITDLFELESFWIAFRYLLGAIFGLDYSILRIDQGNVEEIEAANSSNPLIRIGGPGYIRVHLGFAALFETEEGFPRVYSSSDDHEGNKTKIISRKSYFIEGFERFRDVVDLRDRHSVLDEVLAVTRDGVEVYARDTQMVFRVHSAGQKRDLKNPYPYSQNGIRQLAYGQAVSQKGMYHWEQALPSIVRQEIRDFVDQRLVEDFLALQPNRILEQDDQDSTSDEDTEVVDLQTLPPRRDLTESFHSELRKERLKELGLELSWVGVGAWEVRDERLPPTPGEIGPGKTLMAAWRDLHQARRFRSKEYLERKKKQQFKESITKTIHNLVWTWKEHKLRRSDRGFETLNAFRKDLIQIRRRLESEPEVEAKYKAILAHLEGHIGPITLGGEGA